MIIQYSIIYKLHNTYIIMTSILSPTKTATNNIKSPTKNHNKTNQLSNNNNESNNNNKPLFQTLFKPIDNNTLRLQNAIYQSDIIHDFSNYKPANDQYIDYDIVTENSKTTKLNQRPVFQSPMSYKSKHVWPKDKLTDILENTLQRDNADVAEAMRLNELGLGPAGFQQQPRDLKSANLHKIDASYAIINDNNNSNNKKVTKKLSTTQQCNRTLYSPVNDKENNNRSFNSSQHINNQQRKLLNKTNDYMIYKTPQSILLTQLIQQQQQQQDHKDNCDDKK